MRRSTFAQSESIFAILLSMAIFAGCVGGGGGGGSSSGLALESTNFVSGQIWGINKAMEFTFNNKVDISSVSLATIKIEADTTGSVGAPLAGPAQGDFYIKDDGIGRTIVFQPLCPNDDDLQSGGFIPSNDIANVTYQVTLFGSSDSPGPYVKDQNGSPLLDSYNLYIQTASESKPFVDPVTDTPPQVTATQDLVTALELNHFTNPIAPILVEINQPILESTVEEDSAVKLIFDHPNPAIGQVSIPTQTTVLENCNNQGGATLSVLPFGVLPAGVPVQFVLSSTISGLGQNDQNDSDLVFHTAIVLGASGVPQLDSLNESFDSGDEEESNPQIALPLASWNGGVLEAAPVFPGSSSSIDFEIGPGTSNGASLTFDTSGGSISDTNGIPYFIPNGIIECRNFTVKAGGIFEGIGPNPVIIRASEKILIEDGAVARVNGQRSPDVSGIDAANVPAPPGSGRAGGGDGGFGSPLTDGSSAKGENGYGPGQKENGGGEGGHAAYGQNGSNTNTSTSNHRTVPGGGGGGEWGILEKNAAGQWVQFYYGDQPYVEDLLSNLFTACKGPGGVYNTRAEQGGNGNTISSGSTYCTISGDPIKQLDAVTNQCWAQGGQPGNPVFTDGNPENDFFGRAPQGNQIVVGELQQLQGGQGGGGGGDNIPSLNFPTSIAQWFKRDFRGSGGGGGAGVIKLQALQDISILGTISANGGFGGRGEQFITNQNGGGAGGGGAGGMILVESAQTVFVGKNAIVYARGGNRGLAGKTQPGFAGTGGNDCRKTETSGYGAAGGKGVVTISVPFHQTDTIICDGVELPRVEPGAFQIEQLDGSFLNVDCVEMLRLSGGLANQSEITGHFDPVPHLTVLDFGTVSVAQSQWRYLGWSNLGTGGVTSPPTFEFGGADPGLLGLIDPSYSETLATGNGGSVADDGVTITLQDQALAQLISSEPRVLDFDAFQPGATALPVTIVDAQVSGDTITITTDPDDGLVNSIGNWSVIRRYFRTTIDGTLAGYPSTAQAFIEFEGAMASAPGSITPDLGTVVGPTADISALAGMDFIRFSVTFDSAAQTGTTLSPLLPRPGLDFVKIPYGY